ncbi:MAG: hybrid sensor histidine kinase/response regulator [Bdellovibrionaceae bacterium]|nr:hybrid sensor histidine kinase/response regulator [Pseudobdellovibrionaceae bacterium]
MDKPKVICVDDDSDNLDAVATILGRDFHVQPFRSGLQALEHLKKTPYEYSVIISDQRMPEISGIEFLEKTIEINPLPARILFTGYSNIEVTIEAINKAHIYRYLTKPWEPADLLLTVKEGFEKYKLSLELRQKNELLEKALVDVQAMDKIKTNFMVLINHELKTPLTAISSYLELLKEEEDLGVLPKKYLSRIEEGCSRLKFLTNEVMYLLSDNNEVLNRINHGLAETNLSDLVRPYRQDENFKVTLKTEESVVAMAEKVLKNVVERLTQNALRFKSQGQVDLSIHDKGEGLLFEISNFSDPIDEKDLKRITEPFELNRDIMNHSGGLGLGLPIVQVLLKKVGSSLELSYDKGRFTARFVVRKRPLHMDASKLNFS